MSDRKHWTAHDEIIAAHLLACYGWEVAHVDDHAVEQVARRLGAKPHSVGQPRPSTFTIRWTYSRRSGPKAS